MSNESTPRYISSFSHVTEIPEGMRVTAHYGVSYERHAPGYWEVLGPATGWDLAGHPCQVYRIDYDPRDEPKSTLHTIDCHGVDPAILQSYLDGYIAHREAVAEAEALAEKVRAADDLYERHCANREALRSALDAVAAAVA